jgi:hypothetical protein
VGGAPSVHTCGHGAISTRRVRARNPPCENEHFPSPKDLSRHLHRDTITLLMSTHASVLVDSVGPPSAEVCRAVASFP